MGFGNTQVLYGTCGTYSENGRTAYKQDTNQMNWRYQVLKIVEKEWKDGFVSGLCLGFGVTALLLSRKR